MGRWGVLECIGLMMLVESGCSWGQGIKREALNCGVIGLVYGAHDASSRREKDEEIHVMR